HRFPDCIYDQVTAEFGTYNVIRVVEALRRENMATHYCDPGDAVIEHAKTLLKETFAPADPRWREQVVEQGLQIAQRAIEAGFD
ncbi:MAG: DUF2817 domain-containing protein, partial [Deltaproteobacteria bacterium]|nr:DUF2817 domain-containing protein [Deltaproteobacteria bacterium]